MAENKICKICGKQFDITDDDLKFLKQVSPVINGQVLEISTPTFCPSCRSQRRLAWRNESTLYNRKCDLCSKDTISLYHKDSPFKVYCQECFWSDAWDPRDYGQDYNFSKPFFEQMKELQAKTPRIALLNSRSENSEYANHSTRNKDSYLVFASFENENVMFSWRTRDSKDCLDNYACSKNCQLCYDNYRLESCYKTLYCANCQNCADSFFLSDCASCKNCYMCVGLKNKQYYVLNKGYTKEEYEKLIPDLGSRKTVDEEKKKFAEFILSQPRPYAHMVNSENCLGDDLIHCSNCKECYDIEIAENCKYFDNGENLNSCQDVYGGGYPAEWMYEVHGVLDGHHVAFSHASYYSTRALYLDKCNGSQDDFGCVSLKKSQFCILNKQYTQEQYEELLPKIVEHMKTTGEWGEFFPASLSPFGYNETMAIDFYPLDKEGAQKIGAKWLDGDYSPKYEGESYQPKDNIKDYDEAVEEDERNKLLTGVIKCEAGGRAFKILPRELAFYIENNIPIPTKHFLQRHADRMKAYRPVRQLWHRQCMCEAAGHDHEGPPSAEATGGKRCKNEFETTYAPERPEKVYCESCYQKAVI